MSNTQNTLSKLELSAIPGADRLIGMIGRASLRNKIILAFVIAVCLSILLLGMGVVSFTPSPSPSQPPNA